MRSLAAVFAAARIDAPLVVFGDAVKPSNDILPVIA
jgi:hypothetical protein